MTTTTGDNIPVVRPRGSHRAPRPSAWYRRIARALWAVLTGRAS